MSFHEKLKELRLQNNLSQEKLAWKLGIVTRTYLYYEKGQKYPSVELLTRIAKFFNVSISYLMDEQDELVTNAQTELITNLQTEEGKHEEFEANQLAEEIGSMFAEGEFSEPEKTCDLQMSFHKKLKELRLQNNLSQEKLAIKLDIATSTYIHYEKGHVYPSVEILIRIAKIFNVSTDFLLDEQYDVQTQDDKRYNLEAKQLVNGIRGLFARSELSEEEKDALFDALQEILDSEKEKRRE